MSVTEENEQCQKPQKCGLARASLILGICAPVVSAVIWVSAIDPLTLLPECASLFAIAVIGLVLGILALFKIATSNRMLTGSLLALFGVLINSFWLFGASYGYWLDYKMREASNQLNCSADLRDLGIAMRLYTSENDNKYPTLDKWCDLLEKGNYVLRGQLRCPGAEKGPCSYAINPNCELNSPNDIVLLFETKGGWNQFGGPELLTFENHGGKGCNMLFNDGHVEFVKPEKTEKLRWKDQEGNK